MSLFKLFLIFLKIGAILLGGGYVILPIMQNEFVDRRKLISQDELLSYFTLSQSLPGIIAANMSMFVGYKLCGKFGAVLGMLGIITVPFCAIVILASILDKLVGNTYVQGAMWGIGISVIALILLTIREMWQNSVKNLFFYFIFTLSLLTLLLLKLSPINVIIVFSLIGVGVKTIQRRMSK